MPVAERNRLPRLQREIRQAPEISDQCQGAIADIGFADTDEFIAGAQIETAFENGLDGRDRMAPAELPRQDA